MKKYFVRRVTNSADLSRSGKQWWLCNSGLVKRIRNSCLGFKVIKGKKGEVEKEEERKHVEEF